jgi:hypothetical protein
VIRAVTCGAAWLAVVACGGKESPSPAAPSNVAAPVVVVIDAPVVEDNSDLAAMMRFADDMCACTDRRCAITVWNQMNGWAEASPRLEGVSDAIREKADAAYERYRACWSTRIDNSAAP